MLQTTISAGVDTALGNTAMVTMVLPGVGSSSRIDFVAGLQHCTP